MNEFFYDVPRTEANLRSLLLSCLKPEENVRNYSIKKDNIISILYRIFHGKVFLF